MTTSGWVPGTTQGVTFDSTVRCSVPIGQDGSGSVLCTVPHVPSGPHPVKVGWLGNPDLSVGPFTVVPALVGTITPVAAGDYFSVSGSGFGAYSAVQASLDGTAVTMSYPGTSSVGDLLAQYARVPVGVAPGPHVLTITDSGGASATLAISVAYPALSFTGRTASTFEVTGSAWTAGDHVSLTSGGTTSCTVVVSTSATPPGSFRASGCTAPSVGAFSVVATSAEHGTTATVDVPALPPPGLLSPASRNVSPGSYVDVTGSGFVASSPLTVTMGGTAVPSVSPNLTSDAYGNVAFRLVVPDLPAGDQTVTLTDGADRSRSAVWHVFRPTFTYSTTAVAPGDAVTVSVSGAVPTLPMSLSIDGASACSIGIDSAGNGSASCTTPSYLSTGPVPVVGRVSGTYLGGDSSGVVANGPDLTGSGSMVLPASKFVVGVSVPFAGSGFSPGAPVTLSFDGSTVAGPVVAGSDGSASGSVVIPVTGTRLYTAVLADDQGHQLTQRISVWSPTLVPSATTAGPGIATWEPPGQPYTGLTWPDGDRVVVTVTDGTHTVTCSGNSNRWVGGCRIVDLPSGTYTVTARLAHSPYVFLTLPSITVP